MIFLVSQNVPDMWCASLLLVGRALWPFHCDNLGGKVCYWGVRDAACAHCEVMGSYAKEGLQGLR